MNSILKIIAIAVMVLGTTIIPLVDHNSTFGSASAAGETRMWVSSLTLTKVGQRLKASATVIDEFSNPVKGAVVTVKISKPFVEGEIGGVYRDYITDKYEIVADYAPAGWVLHTTDTYEVKICYIALAGYVWDYKQGYRSIRTTW